MADLRLKGFPLATVRALAESSLTRGALWKVVSSDFHIKDLASLPKEALGKVEEVPAPIQGAPPRSWGEKPLPLPTTKRCTGAALRDAYKSGATSPTEVLNTFLQHINNKNFSKATFSPFTYLDSEVAKKAAEQSTERYQKGETKSLIDGILVPIKDEFHQNGLPTSGGTCWRTELHNVDSTVVKLLREQGALLVGKTTVTENGMNPLGYNPHWDMPHNIYSSEHGAGGSSNGSGVAVGLGLATVALGTDGGGSIRLPAAMNGVFGLKPTFNRVSSVGDIWLGTVGHAGPIGQSVGDLVDLMENGTGYDENSPYTHFAPDWNTVKSTWRPALTRGIKGCRIGVLRDEFVDADPKIVALITSTLNTLEREGAVLVDVHIDRLRIVNAIGPLIIAGESAANASVDLEEHRDQFSDELRLVYALMKVPTAQQFLRASRARTGIRLRTAAAMAGVDVLASPTHARLAAPYALSENRAQLTDTAWIASMTRFSFLGNLTGLPCINTPIGMVDGLPVGMQFMADAWDEASCIAVAAHVERLGISDLPLPEGYIHLLNG